VPPQDVQHIEIHIVPDGDVAADLAASGIAEGDRLDIHCPRRVTREVREACVGMIADFTRKHIRFHA